MQAMPTLFSTTFTAPRNRAEDALAVTDALEAGAVVSVRWWWVWWVGPVGGGDKVAARRAPGKLGTEFL